MDLASYGYTLAALLHSLLAIDLARNAVRRKSTDTATVAAIGAVATTAVWGAATAVASHFEAARILSSLSDVVRYGLWLTCLLSLLKPAAAAAQLRTGLLASAVVAVFVPALALTAWHGLAASGALPVRALFAFSLALPVLGLVLVEQLYRGDPDEAHWGSKPFSVALGMLFMFDIYLHSEAALFARLDEDTLRIRGVVHAASVPLLFIAHRRQEALLGSLRLSRTAAFHTATLLLVGVYLLFVSAAGYYVGELGGEWGNALRLGLMFLGGAALVVILLSGSMRSRLRVFIGKHFYRYRYDYRAEWLRFTSRLSAAVAPHEVDALVVRGLADLVESPGGALWSRRLGSTDFVQTASWNMPRLSAREASDSPFSTFLRADYWIIDLAQYRNDAARYRDLALPEWLNGLSSAWLVVPLPVAGDLIGFVVLAKPRTPVQLNWEVRDLLKTASRQGASFLAQMHAAEALLEARKFDAFNRMSAFVVHDLKNIVTQLSLLMKNAKRLHGNPEFQQDMLATVENSLDKMRQLILQLREGQAPSAGTSGVDLAPILARLAKVAGDRGRTVELQLIDHISTRGHEDRIERVIGHMLQNAIDATSARDNVWMRLQRSSGHAQIVVGDTGRGMTPEFVHTRLFKPFSTTKPGGMGIGAYESHQYVRELGGSIEVDSEEGRGTILTIRLPLFDTRQKTDLNMVSAK